MLPLRWALGGSRGRSRAFGDLRRVNASHCDESRFRRGFRGFTRTQFNRVRVRLRSALSRLKHGFESRWSHHRSDAGFRSHRQLALKLLVATACCHGQSIPEGRLRGRRSGLAVATTPRPDALWDSGARRSFRATLELMCPSVLANSGALQDEHASGRRTISYEDRVATLCLGGQVDAGGASARSVDPGRGDRRAGAGPERPSVIARSFVGIGLAYALGSLCAGYYLVRCAPAATCGRPAPRARAHGTPGACSVRGSCSC